MLGVTATRSMLAACQAEVARLAVKEYYAQAYRATERSQWGKVLEWMTDDFDGAWPLSCLDVGCAYGTLLLVTKELSPGCALYGVDFSPDYMSMPLVGKHRIKFAMCNVELDPLPWSMRFDSILLTETLEHFNFQAAPTLRKLRDALAPSGRMYLSTPDASEWGRITDRYPDYASLPMPGPDHEIVDAHVWQFTKPELCRVTEDAGLRITRIGYSPGAGMGRHFNLTLEAA